MNFNINEEIVKQYVKERFVKKYDENIFEESWDLYKKLDPFKINENIYDVNKGFKNSTYRDSVHYIIRLTTQFFITKAFEAMLVDLNDPNVAENLDDENIGTPGRIAKMWCGSNIYDDRELLGGRFNEPVRLAKFPHNSNSKKLPIIKEIDLTAVCSHHLAPFSTKFSNNAKVIVAYIPNEFVLGISKLQRVVRYIAQRGWLQEDLTKAIYDEIVNASQTYSVYVKLKNIKHSCEFLRGAITESDGFTTEYYGGLFEKDPDLLDMVRNY